MKIKTILPSLSLALLLCARIAATFAASSQSDWEKLLSAAYEEGQVSVYGPPGNDYRDAIVSFQEAHPKMKVNYFPGSGTDNSQRLLTERRAEKYLADIFIGGSGTLPLLFKGNVLDPLPPFFVLPEVKDPSGWYSGKHIYADPKNQYVFMMAGNVNSSIAAYNTKLVNPSEIKSFWDVLQPKWKSKITAYDPRARGHIQTMRGIYYNPKVGGEFLRRLFGEMDVQVSRDPRQMLDWIAKGKYLLYLFSTSNDVDDVKKKGLPVDVIDAPPQESHMSGGFGHLGLVNKAPHPNGAKLFVNWILSKDGQLAWQKKTDNNSLRMDIPKDMLTDQREVPKAGEKYLNASLPQYEDVKPVLKILEAALAKSGK